MICNVRDNLEVIRVNPRTTTFGSCTLASVDCATCHTKFFTPLDLVNSPRKAELHLLDEFASHKCKAHFADAA